MTKLAAANIFEEKKMNPIMKWVSLTWRVVLGEFFTTTLLLIFGCMSSLPVEGYARQQALFSPLGFGLTGMIITTIFGHVSGAYMNPFLTITGAIWGFLSIPVCIAYILAQVTGALVGYGIFMLLTPMDVAAEGVCVTSPTGITQWQAVGVEAVLAAALSLVNCAAVFDPANKHNTDATALKFGFTVAGLSIAGGNLSGASMNPARSLAPAIWSNRLDDVWIYWVGPMLGGITSAVLYKYVWLKKSDKSDSVL